MSDSQFTRTVVHVLGPASVAGTPQILIVGGLAKALLPKRYRVKALFTLEDGSGVGRLRAADVPAARIPCSGIRDPIGIVRLARALRSERPAIVHLHVGGRSVTWPARASGAHLIAHLHASHDEHGEPLALGSFAQSADAVIAVSRFVASLVRTPTAVISPGIDPPGDFTPPPAGPPWVIGSAGRLVPIKGYEHLLAALRLLRDRDLDVRLELAGSGSGERSLRHLARTLGLNRAVTFYGWEDDLTKLHRHWHVFAAPSVQEGFGMAVLEAMAAGLPVVASDVGGLPELVSHGRTGYLVSPANPDALADRLGQLVGDPDLRREMGARGREIAGARFSLQTMARSIAEVYDTLLRSRWP